MQHPTILTWPLLTAGLLVILAGLISSWLARRTWDWPVTVAEITQLGSPKTVEQKSDTGTSYKVVLDFTIQFVALGSTWNVEQTEEWTGGDHFPAQAFIARNAVGKKFEIIFNPAAPMRVLRNGPKNPATGRALVTIGAGATVIGLVFLVADVEWFVPAIIAATSVVGAIIVANTTDYPFEKYSPLEAGKPARMTGQGTIHRFDPPV